MTAREDHYAHTLERRALVAECKDILHRMDPTYPPAKRDCLMALDRCLEAVNAPWPDHSTRALALGFLEGYYVGVRSPEGAQDDTVYATLVLAAKHIANARMPEPGEPEDDADPDLSAPRRLIAEVQAAVR